MDIKTWFAKGVVLYSENTSIFFVREGKGVPLLCIHGFPTSSWDFASVFLELSSKFDCIVPDLPGLGISKDDLNSDIIMKQADAIELLMDDLQVDQAHIFAHDIGDTVAQELLARMNDKNTKTKWLSAVFMNGGMFPEANTPRPIQKLLASFLGPFLGRFLSKRTFDKTMRDIFSKKNPPSPEFLESSWALLEENDGRKMIPLLLQYLKERWTHLDRWRDPLKNPKIPMAMINGIEDPISGKPTADFFQRLQPQSMTIFLQNTGHYPHIETPKEVLKAFFKFHDSL
jgi:pimeloyl-ACP methyl ester carboxylesterase